MSLFTRRKGGGTRALTPPPSPKSQPYPPEPPCDNESCDCSEEICDEPRCVIIRISVVLNEEPKLIGAHVHYRENDDISEMFELASKLVSKLINEG